LRLRPSHRGKFLPIPAPQRKLRLSCNKRAMPSVFPAPKTTSKSRGDVFIGEAAAWRTVGSGWKQLFGSFNDLGVSFEWHDFTSAEPIDWAQSFHPGSLEICLNLAGNGAVTCHGTTVEYKPMTAGFYCRGKSPIEGFRTAGEQHQFVTVEFSPDFLRAHLSEDEGALHPLAKEIVRNANVSSGVARPHRLNSRQQQIISSLCQPPVMKAAQKLWYQSKALELMVEFLFEPPEDKEMFCARQQRTARERIDKVIVVLSRNLAEPPSLEEIGREVGCSPFYLSRTFSKETGKTISQYLRQLRMEKAAELLKSGKFNVTEAALEVGYSSLSHFSAAFHETFGCCPGLYPLAPHHSGVEKSTRH
jgi:AraC family transcriptional regulator